jgi:hypothetical protein
VVEHQLASGLSLGVQRGGAFSSNCANEGFSVSACKLRQAPRTNKRCPCAS